MPDYDWEYPLRFDPKTGDLALVVIGSGIEIGQCATHISDTPLGSERARPDFGRPELAYGQGEQGQRAAASLLQQAVDTQEPRAVGQYSIEILPSEDRIGRMVVDVRTVADSTPSEDAS